MIFLYDVGASSNSSEQFELAVRAIEIFKTNNVVNMALVACLERQPYCVLFETQILEMLSIALSAHRIETLCDPYLLAAFLFSASRTSNSAQSLAAFLSTRNTWFSKLIEITRIFSKDASESIKGAAQ